MALAGGAHVLVAVQPQLDWPASAHRQQRRQAGPLRRLEFFAAKRPAHAPTADGDLMRAPAQRVGNQLLHLAGVLGGAPHAGCRRRRAGRRKSALPDKKCSCPPTRAWPDKRCGAAAKAASTSPRCISNGGSTRIRRPPRCRCPAAPARLDVDLRQPRRLARLLAAVGGHHKQRLAKTAPHPPPAAGRRRDGATVAGNIPCGERRARRGRAHRASQRRAGGHAHRGPPNGGVQGAGQFGQVIQIVGGAADVQRARFRAAGPGLPAWVGCRRASQQPSRLIGARAVQPVPAWPWLSSQKRHSSCAATWRR